MRCGGRVGEREVVVGPGDEGVLARERPVVGVGFVAVGEAALAEVASVEGGDRGEGGG